jgi:hypothetical protein
VDTDNVKLIGEPRMQAAKTAGKNMSGIKYSTGGKYNDKSR